MAKVGCEKAALLLGLETTFTGTNAFLVSLTEVKSSSIPGFE